jgi:hypothetical protein
MSSQGPNTAGSGSQGGYTGSGPGSVSWTNPGNIGSTSSSSVASAADGSHAGNTKSLDGSNFGFSIPSGATINGVAISLQAKANESGVTLSGVLLVNGVSRTPAGGTNANGDTVTNGSYTTYNWGGPTDLWGIASSNWTPTLVNGSTYSTDLSFSVWLDMEFSETTVDAYDLTATVYYTTASGFRGLMLMGCGT